MATNYLPGKYDLPSVPTGDTWPGIAELSIEINGSAPTLALSSARMQFRDRDDDVGNLVLELTSSGGEITINDADTWNITIEPLDVTLAAGTYYYDLETTDTDSQVTTYLEGTWLIQQDISR
jgi:hypothetical protein